jgi:hypothetical protein
VKGGRRRKREGKGREKGGRREREGRGRREGERAISQPSLVDAPLALELLSRITSCYEILVSEKFERCPT